MAPAASYVALTTIELPGGPVLRAGTEVSEAVLEEFGQGKENVAQLLEQGALAHKKDAPAKLAEVRRSEHASVLQISGEPSEDVLKLATDRGVAISDGDNDAAAFAAEALYELGWEVLDLANGQTRLQPR